MTRVKQGVRRHPLATAMVIVLVVGAGLAAWAVVSALRPAPSTDVAFVVPQAPKLSANGPDETVYRIDASRSSVSYEVQEILAGTEHEAVGSTKGVAGDVVLNTADPSKSRMGQIVVDVQQLQSDQQLRDDRIRHDFLQSADYPLATLDTTSITGLPATIADGTSYPFELTGDLHVKQATKPVTFKATASRSNDELKINATTTVRLADLGVGPISLGPLVKTGETADLTIDLTAVDAAKPVPAQLAAPAAAQKVSTGGPSFKGQIQPILESSCASCHNDGQAGSQAWKLDNAGDAAKVATGLGVVTKSGYMPPWPASDVNVPLKHDARLSADQVDAISQWASTGGALDVDAATPIKPTPKPDDVRPLRRDEVLPIPEPYQGSPDNVNDYRCFLLDPKITDTSYITGFQFEPDQKAVVHHALAFRTKASQREKLEKLDADSPGSGWPCYVGSPGPGGEASPSGQGRTSSQIMGWAPGQGASVMPDGAGIKMDTGDFIVVQIHYHFLHQAPLDRSTFVLELARNQTLDDVDIKTYLAPAEIPCRTGESGPLCDRDNAMKRLTEQFGPAAATIGDGLNLLCGTKPTDYAGMTNGIANASCNHRVGSDGELLSVVGHMHEIGTTFRMTLNPGTPDEKVLLDIPSWDFNWQLIYSPVQRIDLKKGDTIRVECSWDRSKMRTPEPRYIIWSEGTEDEMCYSVVSTIKHKDK